LKYWLGGSRYLLRILNVPRTQNQSINMHTDMQSSLSCISGFLYFSVSGFQVLEVSSFCGSRNILRRIILRLNLPSLEIFFSGGGRFFDGVFFARKILCWTILRWKVFRSDDSSSEEFSGKEFSGEESSGHPAKNFPSEEIS
jgi:hypothetical protein